eukprot:CAMPEP_0119172990 /NCGR_PEP_ID=MMETSP1315-20130426/31050_1 /TAXON_ID=676789 /ORGANISM="Prasinoderma singularis, Strain RCC927" /LENGTH=30 /DNA_ID= /DNA_START= /DNA_END= /DNA_ORIENTATION=
MADALSETPLNCSTTVVTSAARSTTKSGSK